jgi:hypothetical protein
MNPPLAPGLKASYNKMKRGWTAGGDLHLASADLSHSRRTWSSPVRSTALQQATVTLPIVFANALDGVDEGCQRATAQPLPDSMSGKFALQWRYNGCVAS